MRLRDKILVYILGTMVLINFCIIPNLINNIKNIYENIETQRMFNYDITTFQHKLAWGVIDLIYKDKINDMTLGSKIQKEIKRDKIDSRVLEKKLQMVNVVIYGAGLIDNKTVMWSGSGITLKYNNKYYILTAAHLAAADSKLILKMYENDDYISDLEIVKIDINNDLMLLVPTNKEIAPKFYTELADMEPLTAEKVLIVGNPASIEDVVSEGRVACYQDEFMIVKNDTWFGNSGGGVYNLKGELVGVASAISAVRAASEEDIIKNQASKEYEYPPYMLDLMIRLQIIKDFLNGVA